MTLTTPMETTSPTAPSWLTVQGTQIVDEQGRPRLLRGVGLGNWLLPEGYMWRFGPHMDSPRNIEAGVLKLVGAERADEFWRAFRDGFITEQDIALMRHWGFDHVRLPINARGVIAQDGTLIAEGLRRIDDVVRWCEAHGLWVLLDLHGAPGGQTGANIDDSLGKPELFMDPRNADLTVELWRQLALRYRESSTVMGYDLLNEPLPNEWQDVYPEALLELYGRITAAIREVDTRHLIQYEGTHWATNVSIFDSFPDDNAVLHFHRYWCPPHETSIADALAARDRLGVPIYMGEGGENTPEWIYAATRMYEHHGIGWNFWPWKKLDTRTSPLSIHEPANWEAVTDAESPGGDVAWQVLQEYLQTMAPERCEVRHDVIDALFARSPRRVAAWGGLGEAATRAIAAAPGSLWAHGGGQPYTEEELAYEVVLEEGESLRFALAAQPAEVVLDADEPEAFLTQGDDDAVVVTASRRAALRAVSFRDDDRG